MKLAKCSILLAVLLTTALLTSCKSEADKIVAISIKQCKEKGVSSSLCVCSAKEMLSTYGEQGFLAMDKGIFPEDLAQTLGSIRNRCGKSLGSTSLVMGDSTQSKSEVNQSGERQDSFFEEQGADQPIEERGDLIEDESDSSLTVVVGEPTIGSQANPRSFLVTNENDVLHSADTFYLSVPTRADNTPGNLGVRWSFVMDNEVVLIHSESKTLTFNGPGATLFQLSKPDGWPIGRYQAEVLLDGLVVSKKVFSVVSMDSSIAGSSADGLENRSGESTGVRQQPSFDCSKASTAAETAVCSDDRLAGLDKELAIAYSAVRRTDRDPLDLDRRQNMWRNDERDACGSNTECLIGVYERRIYKLNQMM